MKVSVSTRVRFLLVFWVGLLVPGGLALLGGCGVEVTEPRPPTENPYSDLSTPQKLLEDLVTAYERREIEAYTNLLAPEFVFNFLEQDIMPEIPLGFWNRSEDSTGTRGLFSSHQVSNIRVELTLASPETSIAPEPGDTAVRIEARAELDVDLAGGDITLRVDGDGQDFYLRLGRAHDRENPGRWYLYRWDDAGHVRETSLAPQVESSTWGRIKSAFR